MQEYGNQGFAGPVPSMFEGRKVEMNLQYNNRFDEGYGFTRL